MNEELTDASEAPPTLDAEDLAAYGVLLMLAIKLIVVGWIGLDPDAWYVWPWSWVAFGLMVPAVADWLTESRRSWD
ncbi:MAG: hypothetical protein KDC46_00395 [Thermoleophilia bacterium]|nr:hypothetical protein [Thermoleophilia bacterium]